MVRVPARRLHVKLLYEAKEHGSNKTVSCLKFYHLADTERTEVADFKVLFVGILVIIRVHLES